MKQLQVSSAGSLLMEFKEEEFPLLTLIYPSHIDALGKCYIPSESIQLFEWEEILGLRDFLNKIKYIPETGTIATAESPAQEENI